MINFLLLFLAVFLLFVAVRKRKEENERIVKAKIHGAETKSEGKSLRVQSPLAIALTYSSQAGMKFERNQMQWLLTIFTLGGGIVGFLNRISGMGLVFCAAIGLMIPILFFRWRRSKYLETFRFALQELTEFGISSFKVEPSVDTMLQEVVKNSKNKVLVRECQEILQEASLMNQPALRSMVSRSKQSGVPEYELLASMTEKASSSDAGIVKIYEDLNESIRRYFGTEKKILAKTSGMRNLGYGLAVLPIPMFAFFWSSISPHLNGWVKILFIIVCGIIAFGAFTLTKVVKVRV